MATLILDETLEENIRQLRAENGGDRYDEVWDGVYVMAPYPNNQHQNIVMGMAHAFYEAIQLPKLGQVQPGVNVSDRDEDWTNNFRCPDITVFLNECKAVNRETHWVGGTDFAVEIISRNDKSRDKLSFYADVGVRELLIVDRHPWSLELYRLETGMMHLATKIEPGKVFKMDSLVLPLRFSLDQDTDAVTILIEHTITGKIWQV